MAKCQKIEDSYSAQNGKNCERVFYSGRKQFSEEWCIIGKVTVFCRVEIQSNEIT